MEFFDTKWTRYFQLSCTGSLLGCETNQLLFSVSASYSPGGGGALGPNMYGCVPLRCCDFHPIWEHFPQFKYPHLGAKWQKTTPCLGAKDHENTL